MDIHPDTRHRAAGDDQPDYVADRLAASASPGSSFAACLAIGIVLAGACTWLHATRSDAEPSLSARRTPAIQAAGRDIAARAPESLDLHIEHASKMRMTAAGPRPAQTNSNMEAEHRKL